MSSLSLRLDKLEKRFAMPPAKASVGQYVGSVHRQLQALIASDSPHQQVAQDLLNLGLYSAAPLETLPVDAIRLIRDLLREQLGRIANA